MKRTKWMLTMVSMLGVVSFTGCSAKVTIDNQEAAGVPSVTIQTNTTESNMGNQTTANVSQQTATSTNQQAPMSTEQQATTSTNQQALASAEQQATTNTSQQTAYVAESQPNVNIGNAAQNEDIFTNVDEDWNYVLTEEEELAYHFEIKVDEVTYQEYARIICKGDKGTYWEYETGKFEVAQSAMVEHIACSPCANCIYINEGGTITALNLNDGRILWQNNDYQGSGSISAFDEKDNIYIAGYDSPGLIVIDVNGNTLHKVQQFEDYFWPYEMYLEGDTLTILFDSEDNAKITMDIRDYSYKVN